MRKKLLSVVVVLLGGAWAAAQQSPPGYAQVGSSPKSSGSAIVVPVSGVPPEPGAVGGAPAAGPWNPSYGFPMGPGPGGSYPGGPSGGPVGPGGLPSGPVSGPSYIDYGPGYPGMPGPGLGIDPVSSFGTETVWFNASYLYGWMSRANLSTALVTVGSPADASPGALGQPGTVVVYGQNQYGFGSLNGVRLEFGVNLNDRLYLDVQGLVFGPQNTKATLASDAAGNPLITRPIFNSVAAQERSYLTSAPGLIVGATQIEAKSQLFGFEGNVRYQQNWTPYLSVDWLAGYRRFQLEEDLTIRDRLAAAGGGALNFLGGSVSAPNFIGDYDRFGATNQFNGGQIGTRFRWQSGFDWFAITGYGKLAIGATTQTMEIEGATAANTDTGPVSATGGILALSSNIGSHQRTVFGIIPEGGVGIVLLPTRNVRVHVGYSALYWNSVVRPGEHLDRRVNPTLVPSDVNFGAGAPGAFPAFGFRSRSVTLQTLNVGLEFYY